MKRVSATFLPPIALDSSRKIPICGQLYEWFRRAICVPPKKPHPRLARSLCSTDAVYYGAFLRTGSFCALALTSRHIFRNRLTDGETSPDLRRKPHVTVVTLPSS
jgi:hypothetical protein